MALKSIKSILGEASLVTPEQFQEWSKAWRVAVENGSTEPMLAFFAREGGMSEDVFLQRLAEKLGWPFLDLPKLNVTAEAQKKISTKVAFQFGVIPTTFERSVLQVSGAECRQYGNESAIRLPPVQSECRSHDL